MSGTRKPRKTKYDPLAQPDDPGEIAAFYSEVAGSGSKAEGGPAAWADQPWAVKSPLFANDVWGVAITSLAKRPKFRPILNHNGIRLVIVVTDTTQKPSDISRAIRRTATVTGTFTEARRLAERVRWLDFCKDSTLDNIAKVTSNELALALEDHPELTRDNILFLVWKEQKSSFGGIAKLELARELCHALFTVPDLAEPAVYSDGYDDGHQDDEKDRADWWKRGGK